MVAIMVTTTQTPFRTVTFCTILKTVYVYPVTFHAVPFYPVPFYPVPFYPVPFYPVPCSAVAGGSDAEGDGTADTHGTSGAFPEHADSVRHARPHEGGLVRIKPVGPSSTTRRGLNRVGCLDCPDAGSV